MPDRHVEEAVERFRFQSGCGEHEEGGLVLLNERRCEDGEWVRYSDYAAERERRERAEEMLRELIPWARQAFDGLEIESESEREALWEKLAGPADRASVPQQAEAALPQPEGSEDE